ncbi:alpha/beta hydrolase, partial [Intestinimonas timonensis]|uniref:alpha/beta hydrolase n=1 Tax=Intestinimonas timonensis TaxID=1689270 RepID=UPI003A94CF88
DRLAKEFSVLTFDYPICFADNKALAQAVAELLHHLGEKVWLVGQSLGGVVAQIIAARHPEVVAGLVLSNTCSLSQDMSPSAHAHLMNMIKSQEKFKKLLSILPLSTVKQSIKRVVMDHKKGELTPTEKAVMEELCDIMMELLTKEYERHMIDLMIDAQNHLGMTNETFVPWDNRVLLMLSEDDTTFTQDCKDALIAVMPNPTVVTNLTGGHLALLFRLEEHIRCITEYISERT